MIKENLCWVTGQPAETREECIVCGNKECKCFVDYKPCWMTEDDIKAGIECAACIDGNCPLSRDEWYNCCDRNVYKPALEAEEAHEAEIIVETDEQIAMIREIESAGLDPFNVMDYVNNINTCNSCSGCEEGCAVCGLWFPIVDPYNQPEYKMAAKMIEKYHLNF